LETACKNKEITAARYAENKKPVVIDLDNDEGEQELESKQVPGETCNLVNLHIIYWYQELMKVLQDTFHPFKKLPIELRTKIWKYYLSANPRNVELIPESISDHKVPRNGPLPTIMKISHSVTDEAFNILGYKKLELDICPNGPISTPAQVHVLSSFILSLTIWVYGSSIGFAVDIFVKV